MSKESRYFVDFKAVKRAVRIVEVLSHYGLLDTLREKGEGLVGSCPFCEEGPPASTFRVSPEKNAFYCFHCKFGGNILDFVARREGVSVRAAAALLAEWFRVNETRVKRTEPRSPPAKSATPIEKTPPGSSQEAPQEAKPPFPIDNPPLLFQGLKNLDYGHEHLIDTLGFAVETMEYFGVGYCSKGLHKGRIAIPIHNRKGELVAYAGLPPPAGPYRYPEKFHRGFELFNLHRVLSKQSFAEEGIILVTDFFAVFRLYEAGFVNGIALMGEDISRDQFFLLLEAFGPKVKIMLLFETEFQNTASVLEKLVSTFFVRMIRLEEGKPIARLSVTTLQMLLQ